MVHTIGLIGYGLVGRDLAARADASEDVDLAWVYVRSEKDDLPTDIQVTDPDELPERPVDLAVEAATPGALAALAPGILAASDLLALSGSAFADPDREAALREAVATADHDLYLPHGALFGIDGLVDAGDSLDAVTIEATKAPGHLDFEYGDAALLADLPDPDDIDGRTVLYEGSTRGLCRRFPRNFNSHAALAMAGLGLDDTQSRLVADPAATTARHEITATGPGYDLTAVRDSDIEGVTGDYTLVSTWGSIRRVLRADPGPVYL